MAKICVTPVLGFNPDLTDAAYPYDQGSGKPSPQEGAQVVVLDTDDGSTTTYTLSEVSSGVYGWTDDNA